MLEIYLKQQNVICFCSSFYILWISSVINRSQILFTLAHNIWPHLMHKPPVERLRTSFFICIRKIMNWIEFEINFMINETLMIQNHFLLVSKIWDYLIWYHNCNSIDVFEQCTSCHNDMNLNFKMREMFFGHTWW